MVILANGISNITKDWEHLKKEAKEIFNEFYEKILTFTEDTTSIDYVKSEISDKDDKDSLESCSDECSIENVLQESTINSIKLAFDKNFSDNRKIWLSNYDKGCTLEYDKTRKITFDNYVNKDLIHFQIMIILDLFHH